MIPLDWAVDRGFTEIAQALRDSLEVGAYLLWVLHPISTNI
jgi:hypothetical protein